jgi:hypothetical protein
MTLILVRAEEDQVCQFEEHLVHLRGSHGDPHQLSQEYQRNLSSAVLGGERLTIILKLDFWKALNSVDWGAFDAVLDV